MTEEGLELHIYLLSPGQQPLEVSADRRAEIVRALVHARRQREPRPSELLTELVNAEQGLWDRLRYPTHDEIAQGVRHGAWPLFAGIIA